MAQTITIDFSKPIPVFPLPGVVLMPHAATPLHIFESRYRAMTNHALDSNGLIAMATPRQHEGPAEHPEYEAEDQPLLDDVVCVGYIGRHQSAGDGRYHILLQGLTRARLTRELPLHADGYRLALLQPIPTDDVPDVAVEAARDRLVELVNDDDLQQLSVIKMAREWIEHDLPAVALIDLLTQGLCTDGDVRYACLAEDNPIERARRLERFLRHTRDLIRAAGDPEDGTDDRGLPLN